MVAYAIDALAWCKANLGKPYFAGGCRCEVNCATQDCSGWCVAAIRAAGMYIPCINSSGFARWGREAGTIISFEEAIHTPFALLIRGDDGGEDGDGPKGHIMPCVGDGLHTYEAMGRRYGCTIGTVFGRRVSRSIKVPGLIYGSKIPKPPPFKVKPMFDPALPLRAVMDNPDGGVWLGFSGGRVEFIPENYPASPMITGGMVTTEHDKNAFKGKTLAAFKHRRYKDRDTGIVKEGYIIVATDKSEYIPQAQT